MCGGFHRVPIWHFPFFHSNWFDMSLKVSLITQLSCHIWCSQTVYTCKEDTATSTKTLHRKAYIHAWFILYPTLITVYTTGYKMWENTDIFTSQVIFTTHYLASAFPYFVLNRSVSDERLLQLVTPIFYGAMFCIGPYKTSSAYKAVDIKK